LLDFKFGYILELFT